MKNKNLAFILLSVFLFCFIESIKAQSSYWMEATPKEHPFVFVNDLSCSQHGQEGVGIFGAMEINQNNPEEMFLGAASGGLFYSNNGGISWTRRMGDLPLMGIRSITTSDNFNTIYIALGEKHGYGVKKSTDKGISWSSTSITLLPQTGEVVQKIKVHPNISGKVYAIIGNKVYTSNDAGITWPLSHTFIDPLQPNKLMNIYDIEFKEDDLNTVFFAGTGLFKISITNGQEIWNNTNLAPSFSGQELVRINICKLPINRQAPHSYTTSNGNTFYALIDSYNILGGFHEGKLLYSSDACATWNIIGIPKAYHPDPTISQLDGVNSSRMELSVSANNYNELYLGSIYVWKIVLGNNYNITSDNYLTVTFRHPSLSLRYMHADVRDMQAIQYFPLSNDVTLFVAHDGGISKEVITTSGIDWININGTGLNGLTTYGIGCTELNPDLFFYGQTHNGLIRGTSSQINTVNAAVLDGGEALVHSTNADIVFANSWIGNQSDLKRITLSKSYDCVNNNNYNGCHFNPKVNGTIENPFHIRQPMQFHHTDHTKLYVAFKDLWVIQHPNAGAYISQVTSFYDSYPQFYSKITNLQGIEYVKCFDIAYSDINYIYFASTFNKISFSNNGGVSWTDISMGLPSNIVISDIVVNPNNKNELWVSSTDIIGSNKVLKYLNGTWLPISNGLPDFTVNKLKFCIGTSYLYAATDGGVFVCDFNSTIPIWGAFNNNLPTQRVMDIDFVYSKNIIRIATHGSGIWESPLPCAVYTAHVMQPTDPAIIANAGVVNWNYSDYHIPSGSSLTIDNTTIKMPQGGRFTVAPGAKLIIRNNAKITNGSSNCAYMWDGIYIQGNTALPQLPNNSTGFYPDQGFLVLENCTLEHAYMAVSVGEGTPLSTANGGVIKADKVLFLNNRFSVRFYEYSFSNAGRINDCMFRCTGSLPYYSNNDGSYSFVSLFGVKNIWLSGNSYENTAPAGINNPFGSKFRGAGVISVNSTYWVTPSYTNSSSNGTCVFPLAGAGRSVFKGLTHGVYIYNQNNDPTRQAHILEADFEDVSMGIGMNWDTKTQAYGNHFTWTANFDQYPYFSHPNVAVKTDFAEGSSIDRNEMYFSYQDPSSTGFHGVSVFMSNPGLYPIGDPNLLPFHVYKNNIVSGNGNVAGEVGLHIDGSHNDGLQFQCNEFSGLGNAVISQVGNNIPPQGSQNMAAGNKFNDPCANSYRLSGPTPTNSLIYNYFTPPNEEVSSCSDWQHDPTSNMNPCPENSRLGYYCPEGESGGGTGEIGVNEQHIRNHTDAFTDALRLIQAGAYSSAQALLPQISNEQEHALVSLSLDVYQGGSTYFTLSPAQKQTLDQLFETGNVKVKQSIRSIALAFTQEPVQETPPVKVTAMMAKREAATVKVTDAGEYKIYPNPAQQHMYLTYRLPAKTTTATIRVQDVFGQEVWQQVVTSHTGQVEINLPQKTGIFFCTIENNERTLFKAKVLLTK